MLRLGVVLDRVAHRLLDRYIDAKRPGWGHLQLWLWHLCNASQRGRR